MRKFLAGALVLAVLFQWTPAFCETRTGYVSDMLILTFREGPGTQFKVLKSLPSDTRLTILEEGEKFFKAQLESGDQGWVDKRFVIFTPTKTLQIQALEKEKQVLADQIKAMADKNKELVDQLQAGQNTDENESARLAQEAAELKKENQGLTNRLTKLEKDYNSLVSRSGDLKELVDEVKGLKLENKAMESELARFKNMDNDQYKTAMIKWALAGVGVLLLGWVLGHSVSSKRRRSLL